MLHFNTCTVPSVLYRYLAFSVMCLLAYKGLCQQVAGWVKDEKGNPLPFANVYVVGTTLGAMTNSDGWYELDLKSGTWQLEFSYLGYKSELRTVHLQPGQQQQLDVVLPSQGLTLSTIEVRAQDNPAHSIIRKAMTRRVYWLRQVKAFSCDAYVKGSIRIVDVPDQLFGMEIIPQDMGLDSTGQGYVYLSETLSRYYYQWPNRCKEIIERSKVSGDARGITFNSAAELDLNLYRPTVELKRDIVSPIAPNAFQYYRYELLGTYVDAHNRMIYKIRLAPKQPELPAFHGEVHIVEGLWNFKHAYLWVNGAAINDPSVDTLSIQQDFIPIAGDSIWRMFSHRIELKISLLGIGFEGMFVGVFRNYQIDPLFPKGFFDKEVLRMEVDAPQRDTAYWEVVRPIPLARSERMDYRIKDSLEQTRSSKSYLDSVDRIANKFSFVNLYTGYTYRNTHAARRWSIGSPLLNNGFDPLRGWHAAIPLSARWAWKKERQRQELQVRAQPEFAFAERQWRATAALLLQLDHLTQTSISIEGGRKVQQFNENEPISWSLNALHALYDKRNLVRAYDKAFVAVGVRSQPVVGIQLSLHAELLRERWMQVVSQRCFCRKTEVPYAANVIQPVGNWPTFSELPAQGMRVQLSLSWQPGQQYISYPDFRIPLSGKWPTLQLILTRGQPLAWADPTLQLLDYWKAEVGLEKRAIDWRNWGTSAISLRAGAFLSEKNYSWPHVFHFNGNETWFMTSTHYAQGFFALPYYQYATTGPWIYGAWSHNFEGALLDHIPLLRRLGLETLFSVRYLHTSQLSSYWEWGIGLGKLGFGAFRLFRLDVVRNKFADRPGRWHLRVGTTISLPSSIE